MNKIGNLVNRFKDLSTIGIANLISNAISGIFWFYLASLLGTSHYGEVSYFISIAGIASVISFLGAGNTIIIYTAKGEKIQAPIFFVSIIASIISSIVLFIMFYNFGVSIYIIGYTIFGLATAEILGKKLYKSYSKYLITQKIFFVGLALGFYFLLGPQGVIVGFALSFFPYLFRVYKGFRESRLDISSLKPRLSFMMNSYVLDLSRTFSGNTDKLFVAPMLGFSLLGNYQLGVQFLSLLSLIPSIVYQYILPHDASGNPNKKLKKITVLVSLILAILGVFLAPKVLPLLFPKFTASVRIIQIISLAIIPLTINLMYISKFLGSEKSKVVLVGSGIYILVQISSILTLGKIYGINGVAAALVLAATAEAIYLIIINQFLKKDLTQMKSVNDIGSEYHSNSASERFVQSAPYLESVEKKLALFSRNTVVSLAIIAVIGIFFRLYFFPWGIPVSFDGYEYFRYAIDTNILGHLPTINTVSNNGWPLLLALIFRTVHFDNFLDYMTLQRLISITISVLTIIPIYLLCKRFFDKSYAILGAAMFELEPHIVQNSLFGITDPLFICLITTSLVLFFKGKDTMTYLAFAIVAFATMIRAEGFGVFLALSIAFFLRNRKERRKIISYVIALSIFVVLLIPIGILRMESMGSDTLTSRLIEATNEVSTGSGQQTGLSHHIVSSLGMVSRFLVSASIPTFILFAPIGIYLIFKKRNQDYTTIIIVIVCMIPAVFYAYFEVAQDNRFIFPLFPFFTILSLLTIREIGQKIKIVNSLAILIIIGIIISSSAFLVLRTNNEHEKEAWTIALYVADKTSGINPYPPESRYLQVTGITKTPFPTLSNLISAGPKQISTNGFGSLEQYIKYGKDNGLTHLVLDDSKSMAPFLSDVFYHDQKYPYLVKIFDSRDQGYKYHVRIYKIDYEKFESQQ